MVPSIFSAACFVKFLAGAVFHKDVPTTAPGICMLRMPRQYVCA